MSLSVKVDGVEYASTRVRMRDPNEQGVTGLATAANGSGSQGGIIFDDPDGDMDHQGWQLVELEESDCTDAPRLFTGYFAERTERRGKYRSGAGREIDCTVNDINARLSLRLIDGSDGVRPAETRAARVAWIMGSSYLSGLVNDFGLLASADSQTFDKADYRGQFAANVFDSISSGSIFFVYWDQDEADAGVFFDLPDSTAFTSTLAISNDLADIDEVTTFWPYADGEQIFDPSEVHSKHRLEWVGGVTVGNNATTAATFFPSPLLTRGFNTTSDRIGRASTATAWVTQQLAKDSVERRTITCTVRLPKEKVGLIDAGHRLSVKFTHLTDFQTATYTRVEERLIAPTDSRRDFYDLALKLSLYGLVASEPGGGGTGGFPHQSACTDVSIVQSVGQFNSSAGTSLVLPSPATAGNKIVHFYAVRDGNATTPGGSSVFTVIDHIDNPTIRDGCGWEWRDAVAGEDTFVPFTGDIRGGNNTEHWLAEVAGDTIDTFAQHVSTDPYNSNVLAGASVTPTSGATVLILGGASIWSSSSGEMTPDAGWTEDRDHSAGDHPWEWVAHRTVTSASGSYTPGAISDDNPMGFDAHGYGFITIAISCDASVQPPLPGQWVYGEVITMDGAVGHTLWPYAAGSLIVRVDGVVISRASYDEYDPTGGDFILSWTPDPDEVVTVDYQGL